MVRAPDSGSLDRSHRRGQAGRLSLRAVLMTAVITVAGVSLTYGTTSVANASVKDGKASTVYYPSANKPNNLDCNGWSTKYKPLSAEMKMRCVDPVTAYKAKDGEVETKPFYDNGHYVGHDEPSVRFLSNAPNSGDSMSYMMQLPHDPAGGDTSASTTTSGPTDYGELSPAPWFGLAICDPLSFPAESVNGQVEPAPCTPDTDGQGYQFGNAFSGPGNAFMELQFYPPAFGPWADAPSCDPTRWCVALTIDSLTEQCDGNPGVGADCGYQNPACVEPVNVAFLTTNGVPFGPPSPQLANYKTNAPELNPATLFMNQGDSVGVHIFDTTNGLETRVDDYSTGQSGWMVASGANGFANTNPETCAGYPFNFHPEFNTAADNESTSWSALEGGVLMEQEIGHFEPCNAVTNQFPVTVSGVIQDNNVYQTCNGGYEGASATGEGPCDPSTGNCTTATTEGNSACPNNNFYDGSHCEYSDAACMPVGPRTVTITQDDGSTYNESWKWPVAGCEANAFQNGDLDFDGSSYQSDWPDAPGGADNVTTDTRPSSFRYIGPFDAQGDMYPGLEFETDAAGSEQDCTYDPSTDTTSGCAVPPASPATFYPFWSITNNSSQQIDGVTNTVGASTCVWQFGNTNTDTTDSFGGSAQYGSPDTSFYYGTLISAPMNNPTYGGYANGTSGATCAVVTQNMLAPAPAFAAYQLDVNGGVTQDSADSAEPLSPDADATGFGWPIAAGIASLHTRAGGYILDGWGGVNAFGGAPAATTSFYEKGWYIARSFALLPDDSGGYILDGWGGIHPFSTGSNAMPPPVTVSFYEYGWDIARAIVLLPDGTGGYVLDGWGGIHPFAIGDNAMPPSVTVSGYWKGWDIARSLTMSSDGSGGYVLDGWGGLHPYAVGGSAMQPNAIVTGYMPGADIMRQVALVPGFPDEGWVIDAYGHIYPWGTANAGIAPTFGATFTTSSPFTRGFAIRPGSDNQGAAG